MSDRAESAAWARKDRQWIANASRRIDRAMRFPHNTDPSLRHVLTMARNLSRYGVDYIINEEPQHAAVSMMATVEALLKARNEIERLKARAGE